MGVRLGGSAGQGANSRAGTEGSRARLSSGEASLASLGWLLLEMCTQITLECFSGDLLFCKRLEDGSASSEEMSWGPGRHRLAELPVCVTHGHRVGASVPGQGERLESLLHGAEVQKTPKHPEHPTPPASAH